MEIKSENKAPFIPSFSFQKIILNRRAPRITSVAFRDSFFILSGATAYFSLNLLSDTKVLLIPIFIILSAITSIMMHFNLFKKIRRDKVKENFQIENYNHST